MKTAITNTVITFCFFMTMVPIHAEELTEAQEQRDNAIQGHCMMKHYGQKVDDKGNLTFLHIDFSEYINCLKCNKHSHHISADGGENCDEL